MSAIETAMNALLACTPSERAEVMRIVRGKMIESQQGLLTREDFTRAIETSNTLNEAAEKLGICRRTLQYHMRLLGLPPGRSTNRKATPTVVE